MWQEWLWECCRISSPSSESQRAQGDGAMQSNAEQRQHQPQLLQPPGQGEQRDQDINQPCSHQPQPGTRLLGKGSCKSSLRAKQELLQTLLLPHSLLQHLPAPGGGRGGGRGGWDPHKITASLPGQAGKPRGKGFVWLCSAGRGREASNLEWREE